MLETNTQAPDFHAPDQNGDPRKLSDFTGKYLILYFYPKDDTPGCTKEACGLRDNYGLLKSEADVVGVSADSVDSHRKFAEKYKLPFILLSDINRSIIKSYQAAGGPFTRRITYIIGPEGKILKFYPKVDPASHALQIISDLKDLKSNI